MYSYLSGRVSIGLTVDEHLLRQICFIFYLFFSRSGGRFSCASSFLRGMDDRDCYLFSVDVDFFRGMCSLDLS